MLNNVKTDVHHRCCQNLNYDCIKKKIYFKHVKSMKYTLITEKNKLKILIIFLNNFSALFLSELFF